MEDISDRIKAFILYKGISNNQFGRDINCSSAQVAQMITHKKNFGMDKLLKIISAYPILSPDWLLTGKGNMLREDAHNGTTVINNGIGNAIGGSNHIEIHDYHSQSEYKGIAEERKIRLEEKDSDYDARLKRYEKEMEKCDAYVEWYISLLKDKDAEIKNLRAAVDEWQAKYTAAVTDNTNIIDGALSKDKIAASIQRSNELMSDNIKSMSKTIDHQHATIERLQDTVLRQNETITKLTKRLFDLMDRRSGDPNSV
jgi:uncharacterized coiled-coil protein SlyX